MLEREAMRRAGHQPTLGAFLPATGIQMPDPWVQKSGPPAGEPAGGRTVEERDL